MEKTFFNRNFHYVRVVTIANGKSWTVSKIKKKVGSEFSVIDEQFDRIIVWIDREGRTETSTQIRDEIRAELQGRGAEPEKISIYVPDKMTENLILADHYVMRAVFQDSEYKYPGDGSHGKAILKNMFAAGQQNYKELIDGVRLLKKVRFDRAAQNSQSAKAFLDELPLDCWWLRAACEA